MGMTRALIPLIRIVNTKMSFTPLLYIPLFFPLNDNPSGGGLGEEGHTTSWQLSVCITLFLDVHFHK